MRSTSHRKINVFFLVITLLLLSEFSSAAEIGVYYFPGWNSTSKYWSALKGLPGSLSPGKAWPDREPLLGLYPEEQPWVAEKHIEWAHSYGISFFAYDWYWDGQKTSLNHAIDNYLKAKNKNKLKFTLLWDNSASIPSSLDQFTSMVDYWINHYFKDPQYLTIDSKPVVFIFLPEALRNNAAKFGKTTKDLLDLAREKSKVAGLKGIYFIGSTPANGYWVKDYLPSNGYDAISGYNYHSKGFSGSFQGNEADATSYAELLEGYKNHWQWILKNSQLPYILPVTAGWDRRPWAKGKTTAHDNCVSTPASFREMLLEAKKMIDLYPTNTKGMAILNAWNEFGEGAYVEPTKKWKFKYLQSIKDVFGK